MKKKKKQTNQITIAYIAAGIAIAGMMTIFGISAFLRVNSIFVEGMHIYSPEEIAEASGVSRGDNLLYLHRKNAENRIISGLPYISSAEVTRDLPDTLSIKVTERNAIAYIPFSRTALIIDSTGKVLEIVSITVGSPVEVRGIRLTEVRGVPIEEASPGSLPVVVQGFEMSFSTMQDILLSMEREGIINDVNYLDVQNIINISFGYMDMYRIVLGGISGSRQKIAGLTSAISQIQDAYPNARGVFNMTDPTGEYRFTPD